MPSQDRASMVQRIMLCGLPLLAGLGAALVLLLLAGGPPRPAYADTLTYPGCGATLQDCINAAAAGDTILIQAGDYTESLTLSKAVSLTGQLSSTTILHALNSTRVLTVTGAVVANRLVISGLTFTGGDVSGAPSCPDGCGGGILVTGTAQPLLENVILTHNSAFIGGGLHINGSATLSGSMVTSNTAGSIAGGVFNGSGALTITHSTISHNTGGGLSSGGVLALTSSTIGDNTGSGVSNFGVASIASTMIRNNSGFEGGGIFSYGPLTITSSTITSNTATTLGGGGVENNYSQLRITSSTITSNTAANSSGGVGNNFGTLSISGSTIAGNRAANGSGGGVANTGKLSITSSTITGNRAANGSGGGVANGWQLSITGSTISANAAFDTGGGVYNGAGTLTITTSTIVTNTASRGGGVGNTGTLTIISSTLAANTVLFIGGGLYNADSATLSNSTLARNGATYGGGAHNDSGTLTITHSALNHNTASNSGGGLALFGGSGHIVNTLLAGNAASQAGSALYLDSPGQAAILYSTVASPTLGSGAAIVVAGGTAGMTDTIVASYTTGIGLTGGSTYEDYNLFFNVPVTVTAGVAGGAHNAAGDPAFRDPAGDDYHILVTSAAREKGLDVAVTTDFDGDLRPQGAGFDLGFDEYLLQRLFLPLLRR